jgi:addiction module HigA family antidote
MRCIHPGEILSDELETLSLTTNQLAEAIGVDNSIIVDLVNEEQPITDDIARRLSKYFNTTNYFWLNLQKAYDES